ncbi:MAG TPA: hypothetical protein VIA18_28250 [Polyangia bacterium]|jgi:hypothetical protein|nr:hypothetical protein [Polyangia bacterium]
MPFEKNNKLGGRTEEGEKFRKRCRKVTDKIIQAWIDGLEATTPDGDKDHEIRMKAAAHLADRGYGKAAQAVTGEDGGAIKIDQSAGLLEVLKRLAESR